MNRFIDFHSSRTWITIGLIVVLIASLTFVGWAIYDSRQKEPPPAETVVEETETVVEPPPPPTFACPLDGTVYDNRAATLKRPVMVQIDNSPDARPQSGLSQADIVYEFMAEGGITRYSAIFACRDADPVGPVRSARAINLELVPEYYALLANSGAGTGVAQAIAAAGDVQNINHDSFPSAYWRVSNRYAPHNLMTDTALIRELAAEAGHPSEVELSGPAFKDDTPAAAPLSTISIPYSGWASVSYTYDPATNSWPRYIGGVAQVDALNNVQIAPKNVIIQYVDTYNSGLGTDSNGNPVLSFGLSGSGKVLVFRDGQVTSGQWERPTADTITTYYNDAGREIPLNRGLTWIQLVPTGYEQVSWG